MTEQAKRPTFATDGITAPLRHTDIPAHLAREPVVQSRPSDPGRRRRLGDDPDDRLGRQGRAGADRPYAAGHVHFDAGWRYRRYARPAHRRADFARRSRLRAPPRCPCWLGSVWSRRKSCWHSASWSAAAWRCSARPGNPRSASRYRRKRCRRRWRSTASATTSRAVLGPRSAASSSPAPARSQPSPPTRSSICRC